MSDKGLEPKGVRMSPADILDRLDGVRETGAGRWLARCPAHDDRSPSLSVRQLDDRWLVHCFAGCTATEVCQSVGLDLHDLLMEKACWRCHEVFAPRHPDHDLCPRCFGSPTRTEKRERRRFPRIPATDALRALDHEIHVVAIIAHDIVEHREIDEATWSRLSTAASRIGAARALCCPMGRTA